jgi:hypothetical protein
MRTNNTTNGRRLGSCGNGAHKSDIEVWADYLVACALQTDAKTLIAENEPVLWKSAMEMKDERIAMVLTLEAVLVTPDAATTLVRQIRAALFVEIRDQYHEQLDPRVREVIKTLHE